MSSTTAARTRGRAPRRLRGPAKRPPESTPRRRERPALSASAEVGGSIAQVRTGLTDALRMLKRHGDRVETGLRREITRVRTLVRDEVRYYRENQPPLLNPLPFPL